MKFEVIRTDINKTVLKASEYIDEAAALGSYMSALMLAGILKMSDKHSVATPLGNSQYRLANGWTLEIRAI